MSIRVPAARRGAALVLVAATTILLAGLALMMTESTVANVKAETGRRNDLALVMATESAANLAMNHLQRNTPLLTTAITNRDKTEHFLGPTDLAITTSDGRINGRLVGASWQYLGKRWVDQNEQPWPTQPADPYNPGAEPAGAYGQDSFMLTTIGTTGTDVKADDLRAHRIDTLFTLYPVTAITDAMFANLGYDWSGSASTDSFDSDVSAHPSYTDKNNKNPHGKNGDIGSATAITGTDNDSATGPVYGNINVDTTKVLPPVIYPYDNAPAATGLTLTGTLTLDADTYHYKFIDTSGGTLRINGNVTIYVDGYAVMTGGLQYVTADSVLKVIQGDYDGQTGTVLNGNNEVGDPLHPDRYWFMTAFDGHITFNGNAAFGGVIYAPKASFKLNGTFDFYGAIVANYFGTTAPSGEDDMGKVVGNFWFHYDEKLGRMTIPLTPRLGVTGWRARSLAAAEVDDVTTIIEGLK